MSEAKGRGSPAAEQPLARNIAGPWLLQEPGSGVTFRTAPPDPFRRQPFRGRRPGARPPNTANTADATKDLETADVDFPAPRLPGRGDRGSVRAAGVPAPRSPARKCRQRRSVLARRRAPVDLRLGQRRRRRGGGTGRHRPPLQLRRHLSRGRRRTARLVRVGLGRPVRSDRPSSCADSRNVVPTPGSRLPASLSERATSFGLTPPQIARDAAPATRR